MALVVSELMSTRISPIDRNSTSVCGLSPSFSTAMRAVMSVTEPGRVMPMRLPLRSAAVRTSGWAMRRKGVELKMPAIITMSAPLAAAAIASDPPPASTWVCPEISAASAVFAAA